jgi:hypothetical protein
MAQVLANPQRPGRLTWFQKICIGPTSDNSAALRGVTKPSDAHRAVAGDDPIEGHALLEN